MTSQIRGIIHSQSTIGALKCSGEQSMRPKIKVMRVKIVTFCDPSTPKSYNTLAFFHDYKPASLDYNPRTTASGRLACSKNDKHVQN